MPRALVTLLALLLPTAVAAVPVTGRLRDASGAPVAGVQLQAMRDGREVARGTSDAHGVFRLELPEGTTTVRLQGPTLCAHRELVTRVVDTALETHDLVLARCVRVSGRALDLAGQPVRGARAVRFEVLGNAWVEAPLDATGAFASTQVPWAPVRVWIMHADGKRLHARVGDGSGPADLGALADAEGRVADLVVRQRLARDVHVRVFAPDGRPVELGRVQLTPEAPDAVNLVGDSGPLGLARFEDVPAGRYALWVRWSEDGRFSRSHWEDLVVVEDASGVVRHDVRFRRETHGDRIEGRVVDIRGRPVPGAEVEASSLLPAAPADHPLLRNTAFPREHAVTRTRTGGRFVLEGLRPGEYALEVEGTTVIRATGRRGAAIRVGVGCKTRIQGRLLDSEGRPVTRFRLRGEEVESPQGRLPETKGCGALFVQAEGFVERRLDLPEPSPERHDFGDVVLERLRRVRGVVVDADGAPLTAARIGTEQPDGFVHVKADATGHFEIHVPPADLSALEVRMGVPEQHLVVLRPAVPAEASTPVRVVAPGRTARVRVRVEQGSGGPVPEVMVAAEGDRVEVQQLTAADGTAELQLAPGRHRVGLHGFDAWDWKLPGPPPRVEDVTVEVRTGEAAEVRLRAREGRGRLRVLLPRFSHSDADVVVMRGEQPWPSRIRDLFASPRALPLDPNRDIWGQPDRGYALYYSTQEELTALVPGVYTVFARNSYGFGPRSLFRRVVQVAEGGVTAVPAHFHTDESREVPY